MINFKGVEVWREGLHIRIIIRHELTQTFLASTLITIHLQIILLTILSNTSIRIQKYLKHKNIWGRGRETFSCYILFVNKPDQSSTRHMTINQHKLSYYHRNWIKTKYVTGAKKIGTIGRKRTILYLQKFSCHASPDEFSAYSNWAVNRSFTT